MKWPVRPVKLFGRDPVKGTAFGYGRHLARGFCTAPTLPPRSVIDPLSSAFGV
jgi:hypothetical protein